jgi:predicted nucleic acid-binding protein
MNVILDTNVVLDVLANRMPFVEESAKAMALAEQSGCNVAITANTVTDLYFLLRRYLSDDTRTKAVLLGAVERVTVLDTTRELCLLAFRSPVADFEDAVLVESAKRWSADCIVTRDDSGFTASPIEAITPTQFLQRFAT